MRKILLVIVILLIAFSLQAEVLFTGYLTAEGSVGLPYTETAFKANSGSLEFYFDLSAYKGNFSFQLSSNITLDGVKDASKDNSYFFPNFKRGYLSINELYLDYYYNALSVRVGRQLVTWGAADFLTLTNIICPDDFTSLFGDDFFDFRLGIDTVKFSYNGDNTILDFYWTPLFTRTALPLEEGNPLKKMILPDSVSLGGTTINVNNFTSDDIASPALSFNSAEYGARFSRYQSFGDFSFYAFYGYENLPMMTYTLSDYTLYIKGGYSKTVMFGADASIPLGNKTLRFETAYFPVRPYQTSAQSQLLYSTKSYEEHRELEALAGIDFMGDVWTLSGQYYAAFIFGDVSQLDRKAFDNKATLSLSRTFNGDEFEISISSIIGLNVLDTVINPVIKYRMTDNLMLTLSARIMNPGPKEKGEYGRFKDISSIAFSGTFIY
ncbi:MAG: hypothetical protein K6G51_01925 [Sphaerochaetaceae bacterium]|nr:hypothetical protein [Sphaerochaetaceae bacterium]